MNVAVTGGAGFIGRHLTLALYERGHTVLVLDRAAGADLLEPGVFAAYMAKIEPDVVVHLAAQVGRLFGEDDIRNSVRSNAEMTSTVAKACADAGVRLMYASTSEVYGDRGLHLCREDDPLTVLPHNAYGLTKRWGEDICRLYMPARDLTIMRFSMPYGTGVAPGRGRAALPNILWQAHTRQQIPIHRGAERSWCWIGDTIRAVVLLLERQLDGAWNIGRDDDPRPLRSLAEAACDLTGAPRDLIVDVDPPRAQTVVKRLSTRKLESLGWKPTVSVEDGMVRVLEWVSQFDRDGRWVGPAQPERQAA
jgi:nucleoside-diphosphate-sugar epimerase